MKKRKTRWKHTGRLFPSSNVSGYSTLHTEIALISSGERIPNWIVRGLLIGLNIDQPQSQQLQVSLPSREYRDMVESEVWYSLSGMSEFMTQHDCLGSTSLKGEGDKCCGNRSRLVWCWTSCRCVLCCVYRLLGCTSRSIQLEGWECEGEGTNASWRRRRERLEKRGQSTKGSRWVRLREYYSKVSL